MIWYCLLHMLLCTYIYISFYLNVGAKSIEAFMMWTRIKRPFGHVINKSWRWTIKHTHTDTHKHPLSKCYKPFRHDMWYRAASRPGFFFFGCGRNDCRERKPQLRRAVNKKRRWIVGTVDGQPCNEGLNRWRVMLWRDVQLLCAWKTNAVG